MTEFEENLNLVDDVVVIVAFVAGCKRIHFDYMEKHFQSIKADDFSFTMGRRYIRVVRAGYGGDRSVHCFVDRKNGDVLKAASWKAPAKHARGNIFDKHNGLGSMGHYGPAYLR